YHLIREGTRTKVGLVLESGEPREVHHFALLIGYGVAAINPYLAFETLDDMIRQGMLFKNEKDEQGAASAFDLHSSELHDKAVKNYVKAIGKGVMKVMSKMGISTAQSYCGAQIFEAVGLNQDVIDRHFTWTASRVSGVGMAVIAAEAVARHRRAYPERPLNGQTLD